MHFYLLAALLLLVAIYLYLQNNWIQVDRREVVLDRLPPELDGLKLVQLSDLHLPYQSSSVDNICRKVEGESPDLIVMTGDLVDAMRDISACGLEELAGRMSALAPVYAIPGNHERMYPDLSWWEHVLHSQGVTIPLNQACLFTRKGKSLRIIGLDNGVFYCPEKIEGMDEKSLPTILLEHQPQNYAKYCEKGVEHPPGLMLSGHAHGGQVRLPFVGGLAAPGQGLFPKYTSGLYVSPAGGIPTRLFVSRGLGRSVFPFRIHNRPHLPVLILRCSDGSGDPNPTPVCTKEEA